MADLQDPPQASSLLASIKIDQAQPSVHCKSWQLPCPLKTKQLRSCAGQLLVILGQSAGRLGLRPIEIARGKNKSLQDNALDMLRSLLIKMLKSCIHSRLRGTQYLQQVKQIPALGSGRYFANSPQSAIPIVPARRQAGGISRHVMRHNCARYSKLSTVPIGVLCRKTRRT